MNKIRCLSLVFFAALTGCQPALTESWPQWGGPDRDFTVHARPLDVDWPPEGPRQLWKIKLGPGYGTIVSDSQRLYTMYREEGNEIVVALDPRNGRTVWEHRYPCPLIDEGEGEGKKRHDTRFGTPPQSTPVVVDDRVYTLGFGGILLCLDAPSGNVLWSHDLYNDMGANFMRFGYSASPVAYNDLLILPVGGQNADGTNNGIMAFDRRTGAVRWRSTTYDTVYSSPTLARLDGEDLLIAYMSGHLVAVCPATGAVRWEYQPQGTFDDSILMPMWCPGNILLCRISGDEQGMAAMRLTRTGSAIEAERLWLTDKIKGTLNNPVRIGQTCFGPAGGRAGMFHAFDLNTGEVLWKKRGYPRSKCIAAGSQLIILDEEGVLSIATPGREDMVVHASAKVLEEPSWSAPTLSGSTLFIRDNQSMIALDLSL